jgi:AcrR family transcriptional regulator
MKSPTSAASDTANPQDPVRVRIVQAGLKLLAEGGTQALTTRAVAAEAGVQAPTIYRLFQDKHGLLDAVAQHGIAQFIQDKQALAPLSDPLEDLRYGWDLNVTFGLTYPAIFTIVNASSQPGQPSAVAAGGVNILQRKIRKIAAAGLLRVSEERALGLVRAAGVGVVQILLAVPEEQRDLGLSIAAREAVIAAMTFTQPVVELVGPVGAAIALRASLGDAQGLTPGERHLLEELLDRLAGGVRERAR